MLLDVWRFEETGDGSDTVYSERGVRCDEDPRTGCKCAKWHKRTYDVGGLVPPLLTITAGTRDAQWMRVVGDEVRYILSAGVAQQIEQTMEDDEALLDEAI